MKDATEATPREWHLEISPLQKLCIVMHDGRCRTREGLTFISGPDCLYFWATDILPVPGTGTAGCMPLTQPPLAWGREGEQAANGREASGGGGGCG